MTPALPCSRSLPHQFFTPKSPAGCLHRSDRGVQYAMLEAANMKISNPYDNAHMNSFFKTLKYEKCTCRTMRPIGVSSTTFPHFIDEVYNKKGCIRA